MEEKYNEKFTQPVISAGRFTHFLGIILSFIPPLWLWWYFDLFPGWDSIFNGWYLVLSIFGIYAIVEPISYFPTLGLPGTYLSFLSGNIGNIRVPTSAIAQDVIGVEQGTKKAELVSTLGISGSIFTNLILLTIAAFFGGAILGALPEIIVEAFSYVSPAIFGAMFFMFAVGDIKVGAFAAIVALGIGALGFIPSWLQILLSTFSTIAFALWKHSRRANA